MTTRKSTKAKPQKNDKDRDADFTDALVDQAMKSDDKRSKICGLKLRPPTLVTIALLNRCGNALVTGKEVTEEDIMLHCLVYLYEHSADIDEVHGSALVSVDGRNLTLERKAFELGDTLPFTGVQDFVEIYQGLAEWINSHVVSKVEPIPDEDGKSSKKTPPPNE